MASTLIKNLRVRMIQSAVKTFQRPQVRSIQVSAPVSGSCTLVHSPNAKLNKTILDKYLCLPIPECLCQVEYVWIDGSGQNVRSKSRTLNYLPASHTEVPKWMYDGSSTYQADTENSDTFLIPVAMYFDPFRRGNNRIVLCDTYQWDLKPTRTNHRHACFEAVNKICDQDPMFGIEQEFQIMDVDGRPFGWPIMNGEPAPAGPYYCGVGANAAYARDLVEAHYRACLYAGVDLEGVNAEVVLSQWEYQVGVSPGIKAADDIWMARFMMSRIAEEYGLVISLDPKLFKNWNGAGMHTNYSSKDMRSEGGLTKIEEAICKLSKKHTEHMSVYDPTGGEDNKRRMTGDHETSSTSVFTSGVANRKVSVRIGRTVAEKKKGHLEDRRPASNADPYQVCNALVRTIYFS